MSTNTDLANRVIFLTGGAQGIGLECAKAYAQAGGQVVIADINADAAQATAAALEGGPHLAVKCDVAAAPSVQAALEATLHQFGRLDAVHNNAAISGPAKPVHATTGEQWDQLFAINVKSIYHTTYYALEALKASRGCILNTASMVGTIGQENHAAYVATKGAVISLTKAMALDYAHFHVRVNAISPAAVWTPLLRQWVLDQPNPADTEDFLNHIHVLGYCPEGDVVADVAVFLLSDRARFITGVTLPVSGGAELGYRRVP